MSDGGTATADDAADAGDDDGYSGVLGTYPYAFRQSASRLLRSYVVLGGLFTLFAAFLFGFALITTIAGTLGAGGGTFSFVRSFVLFVGTVVVVPLMAPVILVARRHRRSVSTVAYDRALAASGYLLVAAVYLMLVITAPAELRDAPSGATAPIVEVLYGLPPLAGVVPPLAAVVVGYLLHRRYR